MSTDLSTTVSSVPAPLSPQISGVGYFGSIPMFEGGQRMAQLFAKSTMVPDTYKGNIADCLIALDMAARLGMNPIAIMQSMYVLHGRPAWSATFLIACINQSGLFSTPLRYEITGSGDDLGCVAWVKDKSGQRLDSTRITIGLAKAEGWYDRKDRQGNYISKWRTIPEQMLRYRAASFFARAYCPELTMGMKTAEEVIDVEFEETTPRDSPPEPPKQSVTEKLADELKAKEQAAKPAQKPANGAQQTIDANFDMPVMDADYWVARIGKAQSEEEMDKLQTEYTPFIQSGELDHNAEALLRSARMERRKALKNGG